MKVKSASPQKDPWWKSGFEKRVTRSSVKPKPNKDCCPPNPVLLPPPPPPPPPISPKNGNNAGNGGRITKPKSRSSSSSKRVATEIETAEEKMDTDPGKDEVLGIEQESMISPGAKGAPQKKYLTLFQTFEITPEMLDVIDDFNPEGTIKRLQSVIEMAILDNQEDDREFSLDDMNDNAINYSGYSSTVRSKAKEITSSKDPNESFKVTTQVEADVKLKKIKAHNNGALKEVKIVLTRIDDQEFWIEESEDDCKRNETTLEIPSSSDELDGGFVGCIQEIKPPAGLDTSGSLNLVPRKKRLRPTRNFSVDTPQWKKVRITDIIPEGESEKGIVESLLKLRPSKFRAAKIASEAKRNGFITIKPGCPSTNQLVDVKRLTKHNRLW